VVEPLHNFSDEARRINAEIAVVARVRPTVRKKMRVFWAFFLIIVALAWTLFWLCASISVYDSDFSELKNFEIIFFLLMLLGLSASRFGDAG
jgi:hypothetical protein